MSERDEEFPPADPETVAALRAKYGPWVRCTQESHAYKTRTEMRRRQMAGDPDAEAWEERMDRRERIARVLRWFARLLGMS